MFSYDINKLQVSRAVQIVIMIIGGVLAPYQFIFQFAREIYYKSDTLKLVLLSGSIGVPSLMFLCLLVLAFDPDATIGSMTNDEDRFALLSISATLLFFIFLFPCCASLVFTLTQKDAIIASIVVTILSLVGVRLLTFLATKKEKDKKPIK